MAYQFQKLIFGEWDKKETTYLLEIHFKQKFQITKDMKKDML